MRVYISVDMEGIAGVSHPNPTDRGDAGYDRAVELMVGETNAAIEGALAAGATEILVNDSHSGMYNLTPATVHPAARLLQGIGGAMILPSTQSTLNANFQGRDRAIAFGIWGATIGGMAAVGPLLGGWLTTYLEWRWAFYINLPIGILAILGTLRFIGESRDPERARGFDQNYAINGAPGTLRRRSAMSAAMSVA